MTPRVKIAVTAALWVSVVGYSAYLTTRNATPEMTDLAGRETVYLILGSAIVSLLIWRSELLKKR